MDINHIYFNSPDWIKAILVAAPFMTAYGIARLLLLRKRPQAPARPLPEPPAPLPSILPILKPTGAEALPLDWDSLDLLFLEARMTLPSPDEEKVDPALARWIEEKHDEIMTRAKP